MKIRKLALNGLHHNTARDAKITCAETGPFHAVLRGIAIAPTAPGKDAADKLGLVQKQFPVCDHNGPLHPRSEIAPVDPQPDIVCARQLGYFKQRGIELDIARGYGSMAAIQAVSTGQFEMGGAQTGANLLSIMKGLDLRLIGTQGYDATLGVLALEKGPLKTPKDLEGRKIGVSAAGGDTPFLPAYCRLVGVDF